MENKEKEELFIEKDKFKFVRIFIFILLIALLGYGIYLLYQKKFVDNKSIITDIIEEKQKEVNKIMDMDFNKSYKYNGTINVDIEHNDQDKDLTDIFKDINLNIEGEMDFKNNINNTNITTKYENDDLINFNFYEQDNKIYLYFKDYYDKYIEISNEVLVNSSNINPNDLNVIIDSFYKSINKIIQNNEWQEKDEEISIKDQKINTKKNSLILKDKKINDTLIDIYNDLKNNQEFINVVKKYDADIVDNIDENINDLSNNPYDDEVTINLYVSKTLLNKDIVRYEIIFKNLDLKLIIDNVDNNTKNISIKVENADIDITIGKKIINFDIDINNEELKLKLSAKFNIEEIKEVIKKEITNTIKIEDLKDEDINKIMENIGNNKSLNNLIDRIAGIEARKEV